MRSKNDSGENKTTFRPGEAVFKFIVLLLVIGVAVFVLRKKAAILMNNAAVNIYRQGDTARAILYCERSIKIAPTAEAFYNLGCIYEKSGQAGKAERCFARARELGAQVAKESVISAPDTSVKSRQKKNGLILAYNDAVHSYNQGQFSRALRAFTRITRSDPSFAQAYLGIANVYFYENNLQQAYHYYREALNRGLDDAWIYNNIGLIDMRRGRYASAAAYLKKAYTRSGDNPQILYSLASTLRDNDQPQEALYYYRKLGRIMPDYPNLHNDLAGIYLQLRDPDKAKQEYGREISRISGLTEEQAATDAEQAALAEAEEGLGRHEQAKQIIDALIAKNPGNRRAYYLRARIDRSLGEGTAFREDQAKAESLPSPSPVFIPHADTLEPGGEKEKIPEQSTAARVAAAVLDFKPDVRVFMKNGQIVDGRLKQKDEQTLTLEILMGNTVGTVKFGRDKVQKMEKI